MIGLNRLFVMGSRRAANRTHPIILAADCQEVARLSQIAELQSVNHVNLHELAKSMRVVLLPGEMISSRVVREGKDKGQGIGYLPDGTMVVVNNGQSAIGHQIEAAVQSLLQTGAGIIVFAELRQVLHGTTETSLLTK